VSDIGTTAAEALDHFDPAVPIGSYGLHRYGGTIVEEFLPELQGDAGRRVFREMSENDPVVGAMLLAVELSIRQIEWQIEPAHDLGDDVEPSARAVEVAQQVGSCLHDMEQTWPDVISEALEMLPYGWAWSEVTYKRRRGDQPPGGPASSIYDDGWWGWASIASRSQSSLQEWLYGEDQRTLVGMRQYVTETGEIVDIPLAKSLHFRTSARRGNPEGRSLLRSAYRPWFFKRRIEEYEAIGIERDLAGLPMATVPDTMLGADASAAEKATVANIRKTVRLVRRNETDGLLWPSSYDAAGNQRYTFGLLTSGGTRQFDTDKVISRYDQRIAMTTLADFILLGHEGVGTGLGVSLAGTKVDLFTAGLEAWVDMIAAQFNDRAIPTLCRLNGITDRNLCPSLSHGEVRAVDLATLGKFLTDVSGSGAPLFPDEGLLAELMRRADLPVPDAQAVDEGGSGGGPGAAGVIPEGDAAESDEVTTGE
jgi:hypothetical protein